MPTTYLTSLSPAPWLADDAGFVPLDRSRICIVANSSVAWSINVANYYCDAHGIPRANVISLPLGTDVATLYVPGALADISTWIKTNLLTPLLAHVNARNASALFMSGGTPVRIRLPGITGFPGTYVLAGSEWGYPRLADLLNGVRIAEPVTVPYCSLRGADNGSYGMFKLNSVSNYQNLIQGSHIDWSGGNSGDYSYFWEMAVSDGDGNTTEVAKENLIALYHSGTPTYLIGGRIGFASWTSNNAAVESEAICKSIIDIAVAGEKAHDVTYMRTLPILISIGFFNINEWAQWYDLLNGWGLNASYYWRSNPASYPTASARCPASGSRFQQGGNIPGKPDINLGEVVDAEYYLHVGNGVNTEYYRPVVINSWKPKHGLGSVMLGPSDGYTYAQMSLARGGMCGPGDDYHINTTTLVRHMWHMYNLLRGMTWAEAMYFSGGRFPHGDPLHAPFAKTTAPVHDWNIGRNYGSGGPFQVTGTITE